MRDADGGVGGVDALAAVTAGAVDVNAEIFGVDFEVLLFCLWEDCDGGGAGVNAALRFGDWDALDAVDAALEFELAVGLVAADAENHLFVAAGIVDGFGLELDFETMRFSIASIHAEKVAREEAGFVAAGAGTDFDDGGFFVVWIFRDEELGELGLSFGKLGFEVGLHFGKVGVGFSFFDVVLELEALFAE